MFNHIKNNLINHIKHIKPDNNKINTIKNLKFLINRTIKLNKLFKLNKLLKIKERETLILLIWNLLEIKLINKNNLILTSLYKII